MHEPICAYATHHTGIIIYKSIWRYNTIEKSVHRQSSIYIIIFIKMIQVLYYSPSVPVHHHRRRCHRRRQRVQYYYFIATAYPATLPSSVCWIFHR